MYSSALSSRADASRACRTRSRPIATVSATATGSLKTMVSSAIGCIPPWNWIRQLSRLHHPGEASGFAPPPRDGFALVGLERVIDPAGTGFEPDGIGHMP